jgi:adhesin transport system outer membrane protein
MRSTLGYLGGVIIGVLIWGSGYAQAETLQDAVQYMLQTNPEIKSLAYNRLARNEEITQAKAGYWPILDVSYGAGVEDQKHPFDDTSWPNSTILSLRQNVFSGFADQYNFREHCPGDITGIPECSPATRAPGSRKRERGDTQADL